jgi:dihydrofolate reductase
VNQESDVRTLRYSVAMSLDGFIAGPNGEYDWIVMDPDFDWKALYGQFDTVVVGRRTYDTMRERGMSPKSMGMKAVVVSTTLAPDQHRDVIVVAGNVSETVAALKAEPGKDIWLCGGGVLFRFLLDAGLVDGIDIAVVPLLPEGQRCRLKLVENETRPSGIVMLKYDVIAQKSAA